jgi:hypothetical protein
MGKGKKPQRRNRAEDIERFKLKGEGAYQGER